MLRILWEFIKNPIYQEDTNLNLNYRTTVFFKLLLIGLAAGILLLTFTSIVQEVLQLDTGTHAIEEMWDNHSLLGVVFLGVVIGPLFEELIFRAPLVLFKNHANFNTIFYLFALVFGYIHLSNFEFSTTTVLLSPLLVAPQIAIGLIFGFIRVRFGLIWAMLLHATYNFVLFLPFIFAKILNIPIE